MSDIIRTVYWFCTDFCINAANLLGISYEAFNFYLFVVIFPVVTLVLLGVNVWKAIRKWKSRK